MPTITAERANEILAERSKELAPVKSPVVQFAERSKEPEHIGNGYHFHRNGMDDNGNHSIWVSKGSGRAKKIQTNGVLPKFHNQRVLNDETKAEILAHLVASEVPAANVRAFRQAAVGFSEESTPLPIVGAPVLLLNGQPAVQFAHREAADVPMADELHAAESIAHRSGTPLGGNQRQSIHENLAKRLNKGTYDHEKAKKLWDYYADSVAKAHTRSYPGSRVNPATRSLIAGKLADEHLLDHLRQNHVPEHFGKDYDLSDEANRGVLADHHEENGQPHVANWLRALNKPQTTQHAESKGVSIPQGAVAKKFRDLKDGHTFSFHSEHHFPFSGSPKGPWLKTGARTYRHANSETHNELQSYHDKLADTYGYPKRPIKDHQVGSISADVYHHAPAEKPN